MCYVKNRKKSKIAFKNHKKVVDKNVPLNRLVLKSQNWLNEPVFKWLQRTLKIKKCHFICRIQQAEKARGVGG